MMKYNTLREKRNKLILNNAKPNIWNLKLSNFRFIVFFIISLLQSSLFCNNYDLEYCFLHF